MTASTKLILFPLVSVCTTISDADNMLGHNKELQFSLFPTKLMMGTSMHNLSTTFIFGLNIGGMLKTACVTAHFLLEIVNWNPYLLINECKQIQLNWGTYAN